VTTISDKGDSVRKFAIALATVSVLAFGASQAEATQRLTGPAAKHYAKKAMAHEFGASFKHGYAKKVSDCRRISRLRMRCSISWGIGDLYFKGKVSVWFRNRYYLYRYRIKRIDEYCKYTGGHNCVKTIRGHS